jgi:hypothetical protein
LSLSVSANNVVFDGDELLGVDVVVAKGPTTTSLVSSPNPSGSGQTVTLTAIVSGGFVLGGVTYRKCDVHNQESGRDDDGFYSTGVFKWLRCPKRNCSDWSVFHHGCVYYSSDRSVNFISNRYTCVRTTAKARAAPIVRGIENASVRRPRLLRAL